MIKKITEDISINWERDYNVKALDCESHIFQIENDFCSDENISILINKNYKNDGFGIEVDEIGVSDKLLEMKSYHFEILYCLYATKTDYLVGFVYRH